MNLTGCAIDFGVVKIENSEKFVTALIEVNEGFSIGSYEGLS